ncbi:MAG: hypothetical protein RLZZ461_832 [Planctomycetota bacterium]|jgi:hypothetical protein
MPRGPLSRFCRVLGRVLPIAVIATVSACTPYSTYPPDDTGEALVPWMYPMPQLMSKSLRTTYDKTAGALDTADGLPTLVYAIPADISTGVWQQVGVDTGIEGARQMTEADMFQGTPVWAIEQIRVRNLRAEVDVLFPVNTGYERATVILESEPFKPFDVKFFQRWRVPVDPPVYTGPKAEEPEVEAEPQVEIEVEAEAVEVSEAPPAEG